MTAAEGFVRWALKLQFEDLPVEVVNASKRHILDGIGCAFAGALSGEGEPARRAALALGVSEEATLIVGGRASAAGAALANGALVHSLDFDDTNTAALVHSTASVLPAAYAVAEASGASGAELLTACVAGYELVNRLGAVVRHGFHSHGFHATSVCGVFAAALVSSRLFGLDEEKAVNALGIAGSQAAGSLEFLEAGSDTKKLHPGLAGMGGVLASRLAEAGATGPSSIFEGPSGLFASYTGRQIDGPELLAGLGQNWETTRMTIKPYPACQLSHASLDALGEARHGVRLEEIDSITFDVPEESVPIVCEPAEQKVVPRTAYEGKFSLPFTAAALLIAGKLDQGSFGESRLQDPKTLELAKRVSYRPTSGGPAPADAPGRVTLTLRNGETIIGEVPVSRGGPDRPLSQAELLEKFRSNCGESDATENLAQSLLRLEELKNLNGLLPSPQPARASTT